MVTAEWTSSALETVCDEKQFPGLKRNQEHTKEKKYILNWRPAST